MKYILLILAIFLLGGCSKEKTLEVSDMKKICDKEVEDYDVAYNLSVKKDFKCSNLDKYLKYIKENKNAPYNDVIKIVNLGIINNYSNDLSELINHKYFIKDNLDLYLKYSQDTVDDTIRYVNVKLYNDFYTNMEKTDISKDTLMIVNKHYYLSEDYIPDDLEIINASYSRGANNKLRHDAKEAFEEMCSKALLDGITIYNSSAYRSFETQKAIHDRSVANYGQAESDKTSARPGSSEHQTGLDLDVNQIADSFANTNEYKWLSKNAYKYGFILRYPENKEKITGYLYEPWHYRYVGKEVAKYIYDNNITYEEYYAYFVEQHN